MASLSLSLSSVRLRPLAAAPRPKPRNPKKPPKPNPNPDHLRAQVGSRPLPPLPRLSRSLGGDATTYTRLPPKDGDASLDPSFEIRLSDLALPSPNPPQKKPFLVANGDDDPKDSSFYEDIILDDEEDEEEILEFGADDEEIIVGQQFEAGTELDVEFGDGDVKEKGVPAVMRCFDRTKIYVKAGDGGNGVVAFRREKYVPFGGPSGGDGGRGGNVYLEVDASMNSLLPFRKAVHFRAGRGSHGQGQKMAGAKGEDVVVKVAPGTLVREAKKGGVEGEVLLELVRPGERALLLPGGRGGRGNASFKSGTNKVPKIAENGEAGAEM